MLRISAAEATPAASQLSVVSPSAVLQAQLQPAAEALQAENERLKKLIGELTIANDAFKKTLETGRRID